jgi:hypothetical protein
MDGLFSERRLVSRVLTHWKQMAAGQKLPSKEDIDPWIVGDDWSHCTLIDVAPVLQYSTFVSVGSELAAATGQDLSGKQICEVVPHTLLGLMLLHLPRVVRTGRYFTVEGDAMIHSGKPILYRSVLLPLSKQGTTVDSILGASNYRELRETDHAGLARKLRTRLLFGRRAAPQNGFMS